MARRKGFSAGEDEDLPLEHLHRDRTFTQGGAAAEAFTVGQRWISEMEPELGIGTVTEQNARQVVISFLGGAETRRYSKETAPLARVRMQPGAVLTLRNGQRTEVLEIIEENGLITYKTVKGLLNESELAETMKTTGPLDRLSAGDTDEMALFTFRNRVQNLRSHIEKSPSRGFTGPRVQLIPHQMYIAHETSSRYVRRVLLADEVGLGKTIEACLILHRLLISGRVSRVLIVVPETLVHVWFVELLRKFNQNFRIFDQEQWDSVYDEGENPFTDEPLVLCSSAFLLSSKKVSSLAVEAGWDFLIVDEAHHAKEGSPFFKVLSLLSSKSRDAVFLSATPEQYGSRNLFALLNLLDPARYSNFDLFVEESRRHALIAQITGRLLDGKSLEESDLQKLRELLGDLPAEFTEEAARAAVLGEEVRRGVAAKLLDRFGIGRSMFRNTRGVIGGFPFREVNLYPLQAKEEIEKQVAWDFQRKGQREYQEQIKEGDPRIDVLADLLRRHKGEKFVLICRTKEKVLAIEKHLREKVNISIALFHEDLSLIQRDRNAAYFAEEEGARLLLCSEIGSEGRNFQFAHHLVLFDLPLDPSIIEQRIGRLDRIGQSGPIVIHVPYIRNSAQEVAARWYQEGLGIFENPISGSTDVFTEVEDRLWEIILLTMQKGSDWNERLESLIEKTKEIRSAIAVRFEESRDRLLEQHSFRPDEATRQISLIKQDQDRPELQEVIFGLLRQQGVHVEEMENRTAKLWSEAIGELPGMREARPMITFDRQTALHREDYEFFTEDHPAVAGLIDMFAGSSKGNCTLAKYSKAKGPVVILETVFLLECSAPSSLHASRFLPPAQLKVAVDMRNSDQSALVNEASYESDLEPLGSHPIVGKEQFRVGLLPSMYRKAEEIARKKGAFIVEKAAKDMQLTLGGELERLQNLKATYRSVSEEEIELLKGEMVQLEAAFMESVPRLDAVRLIVGG